MKPIMDRSPAFAAGPTKPVACLAFCLLAGCSTIKSVSPFTSSVPYAQDVLPTVPRPAASEIPVYKRAPPEAAPVAEAPAEPAPPPTPPPARPAAAPAEPQAAPAAVPAQAPAPASQASTPPAATPPAVPPTSASTSEQNNPQTAAAVQGKGSDKPPPTIPADRMAFNDNGEYRNLADVPARPKALPSFADARATEAQLAADQNGAQAAGAAPKASTSTAPAGPAPCSAAASAAKPAATLHFDPGTTTLPADQRSLLGDALPEVRNGTGAIRVVGHGDTVTGAAQGATRFDLAMDRASAVAQALAEFGIPAQRIAVQVGCDENPQTGGSVQLFASP